MPRDVVALHEHIGRPFDEVRLAFDDARDEAFFVCRGGRLVSGAGADAALVPECAGFPVHEHRGRPVFQVFDECGVGIGQGDADLRRLDGAEADIRKCAGAFALAGSPARDGHVVGVDLEHGRKSVKRMNVKAGRGRSPAAARCVRLLR